MSSTVPKLFRQDIQQLRGLAVLAVIVNHLGVGWLPGGYLGVDMFFVVSGFVITSSMISGESMTSSRGRFFAQFWIRRMFRLWPMLFVTVIATTVFLLVSGLATPGPLFTGLSAVLAVSNFRLLVGRLEYFALDTGADWFMHTWSLAVEEQIYVVLSTVFAVIGIRRDTPDVPPQIRRLMLVVGGLVIVSVLFAFVPFTSEVVRFYAPHTRFYQVGAGALVALSLARLGVSSIALPSVTRAVLLALGGGGLIALFVLNPWSGRTISLVTTFLTVLVIAVASAQQQSVGFVRGRWLSGVGNRSYALYLVHWPIQLMWTNLSDRDVTTLVGSSVTALTLGFVGYHFVESPTRNRWKALSISRATESAITSFIITLVLTSATYVVVERSSNRSMGSKSETTCAQADDARVWLSGDSNLDGALLPVIAEELNGDCFLWGGYDYLYSWEAKDQAFTQQQLVRVSLISPDNFIQKLQDSVIAPKVVVFVHYLTALLAEPETAPKSALVAGGEWETPGSLEVSRKEFLKYLEQNLTIIANELNQRSSTLVVTSPQPDFDWLRVPIDPSACSNPKILSRECHMFRRSENITRDQHEARGAEIRSLLDGLASRLPNFIHLPLDNVFCDSSTCSNYLGNAPLYSDDDHLNDLGAELLRPLFKELFDQVISGRN